MNYPLTRCHFQVEWGGERIGFTEVSGLTIETDVIEYREGNNKEFSTTKIPGLKRYSNIILKRGIFQGDNDFFQWWNTQKGSTIDRRDITISLLNEEHEPEVIWKVKSAWPIRVKFGDLHADKSEVAIELLELTHEGMTVENN